MTYSSGFRAMASATLTLCLAAGTWAQPTSECGLRGADTVVNTGVTYKKCLDLTGLDNKTVTIPANVTRIDNTGFALCESSETEGGAADIVYVMDQSGSMGINYAWISPDLKDTVYIESLSGCANLRSADATGFGTLTIPNDATVRTIPKLNPAKLPTGCATSGDPFTQRGISFKSSIDYQAQRAPNSTAGSIAFASSVVGSVRPVRLNTVANINRVKANMAPQLVGGTNYKAPLDTAKKWLLNPTLSANPTKAVIFLSDGRPTGNDSLGFLPVLEATYPVTPGIMPPVYGIFMGQPTADTLRLADISRRTGGQFFLIPPSRPDSLRSVVEHILNVILRQYKPSSTIITNNSTAPASVATAGPGSFIRQDDGSWLINFDKNVPLKTGQGNTIRLQTDLVDQVGAVKTRTINFTLNTVGPDESTNKNLPGTQFAVVCQDLPPAINPVKVAYIKDTDGDGAGDLVVFVFTRPLAALPPGIDAIYWNEFGEAFRNKAPPKLEFLVASNQTVVVADLSASPFPVGRTSIPPGGAPIGILPAGGVFGAQRPPIQDSIGPILVAAVIKPFDNSKVQPGSDLNLDTIVITASEAIRTNTSWAGVLLWSKSVNGKCEDYTHALAVKPSGQPTSDASGTTVTLVVPTTTGNPTPVLGDCVYLNVDGNYTDVKFNLPPVNGRPLTGNPPPRQIELFRGYPPVVGISADRPGFLVINNDPRKGDGRIDYSVIDSVTGKYATTWIAPVGFVPGKPFVPPLPGKVETPSVGTEPTDITTLPDNISTVQVVSTSKYIADVAIFDNNGNFVRKFKQAFGYWGEMANRNRIASKGQVSYLVWDMRDHRGQKAGQGVFVWKVNFTFENHKQEVQYTRTGVMRRTAWMMKP